MPLFASSRAGRLLAPLVLFSLLAGCSAMVDATLSDKPSESMGNGGTTGHGGAGASAAGGSGGVGAVGPQIACGPPGPCAWPEYCCLPKGGGPGFCTADCQGGTPLLCDSQQDCDVPKICCANMTLEFNPLQLVLVSVSCESTCGATDGAKICSNQQDCTMGTCSPIAELPAGYQLCKTW